ncbi:MAG: TRCF domain-containing protein [Bacilli bacterium]
MYVNILSEVINEKKGIKKIDKKIKSTNITIGGYIPSNYALDTDKIQIYQEIEDTQTIASIELLRRKLKDIYGKLPKEVEKILLKRKIDILASSSNIESVYEDNMINIILTKEISLTNGVATMLSNKLSVIKDDIFVRVIDKKFIIKIQKNKESQNNLLYILEVINTL